MAIKFMQSLDLAVYAELTKIAKERGITMQELIRAVIVPDWMRKLENGSKRTPLPRKNRRRAKLVRKVRSSVNA